MIPNTTPVFAVDEKNIIPVSEHLRQMIDIPPSRMFLINKSLKVYQERNPDVKIFDASGLSEDPVEELQRLLAHCRRRAICWCASPTARRPAVSPAPSAPRR